MLVITRLMLADPRPPAQARQKPGASHLPAKEKIKLVTIKNRKKIIRVKDFSI